MSSRIIEPLVGSCLALVTWVVFVPWDLSEVDANGALRPSGGADHHASDIAAAGVLPVALLIAWALVGSPTTFRAAVAAPASTMAWAGLFVWRSAEAEAAGANMFIFSALFLVAPAAVILPLAVLGAERWAARAQRW